MMLAATAIAVVGTPVALVVLAVSDVLRGRVHCPSSRLYLVVVQYLLNDTVEILAAGPLWIAAGFARRLHGATSIARHEALQCWSLRTLSRRASQLLGFRLVVHGGDLLDAGPVIVLSHHRHVADSALPTQLCLVERDWHVRGVIMQEMLADPGFDLIYQRTGHVFIDRADPDAARASIRRLATPRDARTALVIFPEGRLFRPDLRDRYLQRLAHTCPARRATLADLRHLLPPRPHGVLELLNAAPDADVVVLAHSGLEHLPPLRQIMARGLPRTIPLRVRLRRIARHDVPADPHEQIAWLDTIWRQLDDTIEHMQKAGKQDQRPRPPSRPTASAQPTDP
jgi:1-acyl-sn-glycerol-3-phosphate acyltransferase